MLKPSDVMALMIALAALTLLSATNALAGTRFFEFNGIKAGIDEQTGALMYIGREGMPPIVSATSAKYSGLIRAAYPTNEHPSLYIATRHSRARISEAKGQVTITWEPLGPSRPSVLLPKGDVVASATIKAAPNGRSLIFSCRIENKSAAPVKQVMFPDIWGVREFGGKGKTRLKAGGRSIALFSGPMVDPLKCPFYAENGPSPYPIPEGRHEALRKVEMTGVHSGMTVVASDNARLADNLYLQRRESIPDELQLMWEHRITVEPEHIWESGDYWFTPYEGDSVNGLPRLEAVTSNGLAITLDKDTGHLVRLRHKATGVVLEDADVSRGLVEVAYGDAKNPKTLSSRYAKPRLEQSGGTTKIIWDRLSGDDGSDPEAAEHVRAQVVFRPAPDKLSTIMSCSATNESGAPITIVRFPILSGLCPIAGPKETRLQLARGTVFPFANARDAEDPVRSPSQTDAYSGQVEYTSVGYYHPFALRWLDIGGFNSGFSMFQKKWWDYSGKGHEMPKLITSRDDSRNRIRTVWEHTTQLEPGGTWESGEFWLTPHKGGWAKGIEVFRDFAKKGRPDRDAPRHVRDGLGFRTIWPIQQAEREASRAYFRFTDFADIAAESKEHGIDEINLWGWCEYYELPIPLRKELGTEEEFIQGLRAARDNGVNYSGFTSVRLLVPQKAGDKYGELGVEDDWTYHSDMVPMFRPYYSRWFVGKGSDLNLSNPAYLADVKAAFTEWARKGLVSLGWDLWEASPELKRTVGEWREFARSIHPEQTFNGECLLPAALERDGSIMDYTWNWVDNVDSDPALSVLKWPRMNVNVQSAMSAKMAFICGNYLNVWIRHPDQPNGTARIRDFPELAKALKECAALRKQFLPYFVNGYTIGDSVLSAPTTGFVRAHVLDGKMLVFALNNSDQPRLVSFTSDLSLWLPTAASYDVAYYDATGVLRSRKVCDKTRWKATTRKLAPWELAIFKVAPKL